MARTVKVDMTGVESYSKASEGIHTAKVVEIMEKPSSGGDSMLQFAFEITKGDDKGCRVFENFVLTDKALWKFKSFLQAIGMKAEGKIKLDLDKLIGKVCDIEVFWDEYNGRTRAKISDFYKVGKGNSTEPEEDDDEEDFDEDEDTPKSKGKAKKVKNPDPEDEDEDEDDDNDEDDPPAKKKSSKKNTSTKKGKKKPEPEEDDDDDDEEWEEDDD